MTSVVPEHGNQCITCSARILEPLQTEILSTDIFNQMIIVKPFNNVLKVQMYDKISKCDSDYFIFKKKIYGGYLALSV